MSYRCACLLIPWWATSMLQRYLVAVKPFQIILKAFLHSATHMSNLLLLIGVCAVWKGFSIVYEQLVFSNILYSCKNWPLHTTPKCPWRTTWFYHRSSLQVPAIAQTSYVADSIQHVYNKVMKMVFLTLCQWHNKSRHHPFLELVNWLRLEIPVNVESSLP